MSVNAWHHKYPEYGNTVTNRYAFVTAPVTASTRSIVSPAQSMNSVRPGVCFNTAVRSCFFTYSLNRAQYCEYPYLRSGDGFPV